MEISAKLLLTFSKTLTFIFLLLSLTCLKMSSSTPPSPALDADRRKKSSVPEKSRIVTISVNCQEHKTLSFQIKGDAPLKMLVDKYFERASVARTLVDLIYNGMRLQVQRTPDQLGMKDVVEIEAMIRAHGGGNQL